MTVQSLLDPTLEALAVTDGVGHALSVLAGSTVRHLPVVSDEGQLTAVVSSEALAAYGPTLALAALTGGEPIRVRPEAHLFEAAELMLRHNLSALPVASEDGQYFGLITRAGLLGALARMLSTSTPGAIVVVEVSPKDFSLAHLLHLVEQNDAHVLSASSEPADGTGGPIRVTLKLDVGDTARVRHILEHHGYSISAAFAEGEDEEDFNRRIEEFLRYLEV